MERTLHSLIATAVLATGLVGPLTLAQAGEPLKPVPGIIDGEREAWIDIAQATGQALPGQGPGMGAGNARQGTQDSLSFAELDENGDERVSEKELYRARAARMVERAQRGFSRPEANDAPSFEEMDLNGDGLIDRRELSVSRQSKPQPQAEPPSPPPSKSSSKELRF